MSAASQGDRSLPARVEEEERRIQQIRGGINVSTTVTLLLGLAALAALSLYFWYGHKMIAETVDPNSLTRMGQTMLDDRLPELQAQLEQEIEKQAPTWARTMSEQAIAQTPSVRSWLVDYVSQQIERGLDQVELVSADQFRQVIRDHRDILERDAQDLAASHDLSAERFSELVDMFDKDLGISLKEKAEVALGAIVVMNDKLQRLAPGNGLTPSEIELRDFLMMVRRLQQTRNLGGKEPTVGEAATLKHASGAVVEDQTKPAEAATAESIKAPSGDSERVKGATPAGDAKDEPTKPAEADKAKDAEAK